MPSKYPRVRSDDESIVEYAPTLSDRGIWNENGAAYDVVPIDFRGIADMHIVAEGDITTDTSDSEQAGEILIITTVAAPVSSEVSVSVREARQLHIIRMARNKESLFVDVKLMDGHLMQDVSVSVRVRAPARVKVDRSGGTDNRVFLQELPWERLRLTPMSIVIKR